MIKFDQHSKNGGTTECWNVLPWCSRSATIVRRPRPRLASKCCPPQPPPGRRPAVQLVEKLFYWGDFRWRALCCQWPCRCRLRNNYWCRNRQCRRNRDCFVRRFFARKPVSYSINKRHAYGSKSGSVKISGFRAGFTFKCAALSNIS